MDEDEPILSSLPDASLTTAAVESLDDADRIREATVVMVRGGGGPDGPNEEHTDDVIISTDDRIRYLSRVPAEGWSLDYSQSYEEDTYDEVFEEVLAVAQETAELKRQAQTEFEI